MIVSLLNRATMYMTKYLANVYSFDEFVVEPLTSEEVTGETKLSSNSFQMVVEVFLGFR